MQEGYDLIIGFTAGGLFVGAISYYLSRIILRSEVYEMISEQTYGIIKDLKFEVLKKENRIKVLTIQRDIAVKDAKEAIDERNEIAELMISKKL